MTGEGDISGDVLSPLQRGASGATLVATDYVSAPPLRPSGVALEECEHSVQDVDRRVDVPV